jgi:hypothetical protein
MIQGIYIVVTLPKNAAKTLLVVGSGGTERKRQIVFRRINKKPDSRKIGLIGIKDFLFLR